MPAIDVNRLESRSHERPDEIRTPPKTRIEIVRLSGITLARYTFEPGWRWSECVKPLVGGHSCQVAHAGYAVSGSLSIQMDDGTRRTVRAGESYTIPSGHDAWVSSDEAYVVVEVQSAENYGSRSRVAPILRRPGRSPWTLAFHEAEVEQEFERDAAPPRLRYLRTGLMFLLLLWAVVGGLSLRSGLTNAGLAGWLALGGLVPLTAVCLLVNRGAPNMRRQQLSGALATLVGGLGAVGIPLLLGLSERYGVATVLTLMLAVFSFLGLRFVYALAASSTYVVLYTLLALFLRPTGVELGVDLLLIYGALLVGATAAYHQEETDRESFHQRRVSERLLLNILPESISNRLKADDSTLADGFESATVAFADLVGFTKLSASMPPEKVVEMLSELFSAFDDLAARHGLEKIKTIGDAYMVAGGVPMARRNHAEAVVEMALDMLGVVSAYSRTRGVQLDVRIGVHTGPVVAGVIGKRKFIYDLWGDTVNTASRMESHGVPGLTQVSAATWELVRDSFEAEDRGEIEVKGKGPMRTFLVTGRKPKG